MTPPVNNAIQPMIQSPPLLALGGVGDTVVSIAFGGDREESQAIFSPCTNALPRSSSWHDHRARCSHRGRLAVQSRAPFTMTENGELAVKVEQFYKRL